ncbi:imidazole glycerol phosphate synthase subunit HisF [Clostridioides difficile]
MHTKRIIPCLDVRNGSVVKGKNFVGIKEVGDPVELGEYYYNQGADELVFLDITATHENRGIMEKVVEKVAEKIFIPFTVGGGIKDIDDIRRILRSGADKVSLNSAAVKNKELIREAANYFGSQCIVLAVDAKKRDDNTGWNVYINGGRIDTGIDALEWIKEGVDLGAGEILLTSMDADGTKKGFDIELTKKVSEIVSVPVIASGGGGSLGDFEDVFNDGKADAALAASLFHYGELEIGDVKRYLKSKEIPIRTI